MVKVFRNQLTWVAAAAALLMGACTVHDQSVPPLAGPSVAALSVTVTATPDSILQDGASRSSIVVSVKDANSRPVSGQVLRVDMSVGGQVQDYGTLAARTLVTGTDGQATTTYTAPAAPPPYAGGSGNLVTIVVTPTGTDFNAAAPQTAAIRLVPPGVIIPAAGTPKASFTVSPASPIANSPTQLDATASCGSTDASNNCTTVSKITNYAWTFGDGGQSAGQVVQHTFTNAQQYSVTLTVTNDRGLSASTTQAVTVGVGNIPKKADFVYSPAAPSPNQTIVFDASQATPGDGHTLTQYKWNFGDLGTGSGMITTHAYNAAGKYAVTLTVVDDAGQSLTSTQQITVGAGQSTPFATFTMTPDNPLTIGTFTSFDASGSKAATGATIVSYTWVFADGTNSIVTSTPYISHTWNTGGLFNMNLTITDSNGNTAVGTKQVSVR